MVVFSAMSVKVMLKVYCCAAPGSPEIAVPLFVCTEFAVYLVGRTSPIPFVPVKAKVSLDELEVPVMVTEPPDLVTAAVGSMLTNSARPACTMVSVFESTPEAEKVAVVVLDSRPV